MYTIAVSAPQRGTTALRQRLPSMLTMEAFLQRPVDTHAAPQMGKVAIPTVKRQKE